MGVVIKVFLEDKSGKNREIALTMRKGHAISGTLLYLIGKTDVLIGMFINEVPILTILVIIWYFILVIARIVFEVIFLIMYFLGSKNQQLGY